MRIIDGQHPLIFVPRESGRNVTHWLTPRELQKKTKIGKKIASRLQIDSVSWDLVDKKRQVSLPEDQYETRFQVKIDAPPQSSKFVGRESLKIHV